MKSIVIDTDKIILNDILLKTDAETGMSLLTSVYKTGAIGYPKYYKMDPLCRLGFIGAEMLLGPGESPDGNTHAVVVIGHGGSIADDRQYQNTIADSNNYFPSPAVFVYTLANIVTGEISIRHKLFGETSSYLIEQYDYERITDLLLTVFNDHETEHITGGWIDYETDSRFSLRFVNIDRNTPREEILDFFRDFSINS